jgi:integrase
VAGSMRLIRGKDVWELRAYLGRDSAGRVRHRYATFQGSRREADRALARLVADTERQQKTAQVEPPRTWGEKTTVNDAIAAWRDNGWEDLSPTTVRRYEGLWETHVRGAIGRRQIAGLSPYDVERYFRALKAKGMAEGSVRQVRAMLHRACRLTKKWSGGALPNPIADTELPSWSLDDKTAVRAPSTDEVRRILAAASGEDVRIATAVRVLAATGMRRGEVCALRWCDIDGEDQRVRVDESVVCARGGASVKPPKTRASVRTVALDPYTLRVITELRSEQEQLAASCDAVIDDRSFVLSFEPGGQVPPHPDALSHAFTRIRRQAGVPADVHLHSLRHFHATALDPVISEAQKQSRLGWSTVQMARHYTDGVPEEDRRAAEHVAALLD